LYLRRITDNPIARPIIPLVQEPLFKKAPRISHFSQYLINTNFTPHFNFQYLFDAYQPEVPSEFFDTGSGNFGSQILRGKGYCVENCPPSLLKSNQFIGLESLPSWTRCPDRAPRKPWEGENHLLLCYQLHSHHVSDANVHVPVSSSSSLPHLEWGKDNFRLLKYSECHIKLLHNFVISRIDEVRDH
jgi:hypothetical protein